MKISMSRVRRLKVKSEGGDEKALRELQELNKKVSKQANQRLRRLEKSGISENSYAYRLAMERLSEFEQTRFLTGKKVEGDIYRLTQQIRAGGLLLKAVTGTTRGYKKYVKETWGRLESIGVHVPEDKRGSFVDFLETDIYKELRLFDSDTYIKEGAEAIREGKSVSDLIERWEKVKESEDASIIKVFHDWKNNKDENKG